MREFVTDVEDPRLADYARLTDMELRTSLESAMGLFIAEGTKVISRAVAAGYPVRSVLLAERRLGDLPALPATGAPVYVVPDETAKRLTGYRVHRGALASLHRRSLPQAEALAAAAAGPNTRVSPATSHGWVSELSGGVADGLVEDRQAERKFVLGGGQWRGDPENAAHAGQLHNVNVQA
jgi:hypothetical protein